MTLAILQARMSSRRLPGKVLRPVAGAPMLQRQIERIRRSTLISELVVATSTDASDDPLARLAADLGVQCFRGALDDVLDRFWQAALPFASERIVRLTGDCPLADPAVIDLVLQQAIERGADYTSNTLEPSWPDGLDVEVVRRDALAEAWQEAQSPVEREHVMPFITRRPERFTLRSVTRVPSLAHLRWTVDEPADYQFVGAVYDALYSADPRFGTEEILRLLEQRPELATLNQQFERNEGLKTAEAKEALSR